MWAPLLAPHRAPLPTLGRVASHARMPRRGVAASPSPQLERLLGLVEEQRPRHRIIRVHLGVLAAWLQTRWAYYY